MRALCSLFADEIARIPDIRLTDPASSIRVVNKIMAEAHRIEANVLFGDLFAEPTPIADSPHHAPFCASSDWR
jgi:hypothetical protein